MILNLDNIIRPDWLADLGDRAFDYDAFVSHNRNDESAALAQRLSENGARIWHDGDADLADRRVSQKVAQALRASRFVLLCVGKGFQNSAWCKAEYLPALTVEKSSQTNRVLVALAADRALVPPALEHAPRFGQSEDAKLAEFAATGNKLPFSPERVSSAVPIITKDELQELTQEVETVRSLRGGSETAPSTDLDSLAISVLRERFEEIAAETSSREFSNDLFLLRNIWGRKDSSTPSTSTLDGCLIRTISLSGCLSPNTDNRANALMLLAAVDREHHTDRTLEDVLEFLRRESNGNLISTIGWWFKDACGRMSRAQLEVIQLTALRSPATFRDWDVSELSRYFPDCIRCRVAVGRGLGEGISRKERLTLLEERLQYLLAHPEIPGYDDTLGVAGALLGIRETEIVVRELCSDVLGFRPSDAAFPHDVMERPDLLKRTVGCFARIVESAKQHDGWPVKRWEEWALDFIIMPLSIILGAGILRPETKDTLLGACDVLERSDKIGAEVKFYRKYIAQLLNGDSRKDAHNQLRSNLWK
jgi:TIR domain